MPDFILVLQLFTSTYILIYSLLFSVFYLQHSLEHFLEAEITYLHSSGNVFIFLFTKDNSTGQRFFCKLWISYFRDMHTVLAMELGLVICYYPRRWNWRKINLNLLSMPSLQITKLNRLQSSKIVPLSQFSSCSLYSWGQMTGESCSL